MKEDFESIIKKLSPTLRRITHKLNGHFTFFDEDDLFQEALEHLWVAFQQGRLEDKTDSYILQGCYFHLKNYLRKTMDKASLTSLNKLIDDDDSTLEDFLACEDNVSIYNLDSLSFIEAGKAKGLTDRELEILSLSIEEFTVREIGKRLGISHVMVLKLKDGIRGKWTRDEKSGYQN